MLRRRIYEPNRKDSSAAIEMVEIFNDRPWEYYEDLDQAWPRKLQQVGDSLAIAYASDKWRSEDCKGRRERELYKHLAESRNISFVRPGLLVDFDSRGDQWPVIGPMVSFTGVPFPDSFAILGLFEEIDLNLYTEGTDSQPRFSRDKDEGVVKVTVRHGVVGASRICWSKIDPKEKDEPFLFVYTASEGPLILVVGTDLDIEKDGIVG
jgi:hypothetical protein